MKKVIFSGIQPSGDLHLGNYIGAIRQWVKLQQEADTELIFCIVDLHAITVAQDPKVLREKIREVAALYIACGIDPERSYIFVQSENKDHSYLAWIFDCIAPMGWLNRMTQFKDKSTKQGENTTVGLFNYPALMAADFLLYDTNFVPVGEDQKQHIELGRDLAERFNRDYGQTFVVPEPMIQTEAGRIMSLTNPEKKMSKSDKDPNGTINLLDPLDEVQKKLKRAVTDSNSSITSADQSPAIENLLAIYASVTGKSVESLVEQYKSAGYGSFKEELAAAVVEFLRPVQEKYKQLRQDESKLNDILERGGEHARSLSSQKIKTVCDRLGLGRGA